MKRAVRSIQKQRFLTSVKNKLRKNRGVSLAEILFAVMMLALITQGLALGVRVAARQYQKAMTDSRSQLLCSTLEMILTNELRFSRGGTLKENSDEVGTFHSKTYSADPKEYGSMVSLDANNQITEFGEMAFGREGEYLRILGNASYPNLSAKAEIRYDRKRNQFTVFLSIRNNEKLTIDRYEFRVMALEDWNVTEQ